MNVTLACIGQQLTEIVGHQNPFYFCMNGVDIELFRGKAIKNEGVEVIGGDRRADHLVEGRQVHRYLRCT